MTDQQISARQKLLQLLSDNAHYMSVSEIATRLGVSKRSVYYLLNSLAQFLIKNQIAPPRNVRGQGYALPESSRRAVSKLLQQDETAEEPMIERLPANRRHLLILTLLFTGKSPVTINTLTTVTGVARNTIVSDFKQIEKMVAQHNVTLTANTHGHMLQGNELFIRNFMQDYLRNANAPLVLSNNVRDSPQIRADAQDVYGLAQMLNSWLHTVERVRGQAFTDDAIHFLVDFYALVLTRILSQHVLPAHTFPVDPADRSELNSQKEYSLASDFLEQLGIHSQAETFYLESLLLSSQLSEISSRPDTQLKDLIRGATHVVVQNFKQLAGVRFHDEAQLERELYVHLLSTYYRVKYQRQFHNAMVSAIQTNYPDVYTYTKMSIRPFEQLNEQALSSDEISLIAIYFGAQLYRTEQDKQTVLLVCSTGLGTSRLLKQQLVSAFPDMRLAGPVTKQAFERMLPKRYPLVLSTIPLRSTNQPVIVVHPVMNEVELDALRKKLVSRNIINATESSNRLSALLDVIADNTTINNQAALVTGLKEVLSFTIRPHITSDRRYQPLLSELINQQTIQFNSAKQLDWEQAITLAAAPLVTQGYITPAYTQAMIDNVKKNGPYINIGDRVALAHARPEEGVKRLGMSLLKLDQPIPLLDDNHQIQLIFVLAAVDSNSHLKALSELATILGDKQRLQTLFSAKSPADIERTITEGEKI